MAEQGKLLPYEFARRETALLNYVAKQAENTNTQSEDPATQALNIAYYQELQYNPEFKGLFKVSLENRLDIKPSNLGQRGFKALVTLALYGLHMDEAEIRQSDTPEAWRPLFEYLLAADGATGNFMSCLNLPIASNVSERSKLLKDVMLLNGFNHPVKIVEPGSSMGLNLKRLKLLDWLAGREGRTTDVLRQEEWTKDAQYNWTYAVHRSEGPDGAVRHERDKRLTESLNRLQRAGRLMIDEAVGYDIFDYNADPLLNTWAMANTRRLGELGDDRLARQLRMLTNPHLPMPGVRLMYGDAADVDPAAIGRPADATSFSATLYQLPSEAAHQALKHAESYTAPDGLIVVQDFVEMTADGTMAFYDIWDRDTYKVWVKNMQYPELGYQLYCTVDSGRVREVELEDAAQEAPMAEALGLAA